MEIRPVLSYLRETLFMEETTGISTPDNPPEEGRPSKRTLQWFYGIQCVMLVVIFLALIESGTYGWTLFLVIPFSLGLTAGIYTKTYRSRKLLKGTILVLFILATVSALLLAIGMEGSICILMAEGMIALPAWIGMVVGYYLRNIYRAYTLAAIVLLNTSFYAYDKTDESQVASVAVQSIVIDAPREKVWNVLTNPVQYSPNSNVFFEAGISYPVSMTLQKTDDSRCFLVCSLNNGFAALPVEELDTLHRLRFSIPSGTVHMKELTFYDSLDARHLEGYFQPGYGEFVIDSLNDHACKLTARTSYRYKITPVFYWQWWSDYLVNTMHEHVLWNIKELSEDSSETR